MIAAHHERLDGSGYPNQIVGTDIPLYARIAGIVDTFDALTLDRRYASARSGYSALRFLSALRRTKFDAALVDEFIDSLGIYPTGTRVRLDDGSTGFVLSQNAGRPQQPNVLLTNDATGRPIKTVQVVTAGVGQPITQAFPTTSPR
jgi:HD-GYP domain-containing protein (c-di-GMP phosphodiesterase class II)